MNPKIYLVCVLVLACYGLSPALNANTITVTNTNDSGPGSLRHALFVAQDGDTIDATVVSGTILLTSGELQIRHNVRITGPGAGRLAVNGNATSRVFENFASHVTISGFTITNGFTTDGVYGGGGILNHGGLTLNKSSVVHNVGGAYGGGISSSGAEELTVTNSIISGNHSAEHGGGIAICCGEKLTVTSSVISNNDSVDGGGIHSDGAIVTVSNSTISDNSATNGGGILNVGELTITSSTISGNFGSGCFIYGCHGYGGGILNVGELTITNSTISGNLTAGGGGGIYNNVALTVSNCTMSGNSAAAGGGILNMNAAAGTPANVAISNSTLSGNAANGAGGAIYNKAVPISGTTANFASVSVKNSTISGNNSAAYSGGILNDNGGGMATLELGGTILKTGSSGKNIVNHGGTVKSDGYNLASDNGGGLLRGPGDQINTNPMLGPLQHNGGPTFTLALLPGSPAIDAGDPNFTPPPSFDQRGRGYPRVVNGRIDIGSFEVQ
jgi:hypothetical protein